MAHTNRLPRTHRSLVCFALLASIAACAGPSLRGARPVGIEATAATPTRWSVIGESREGRPIRAATLGQGTRRIALIAGIHGDEQEGLRHLDEIAQLVARSGADNRVRIIEDVNPDGTAARTRTTTAGVDPNRNWPSRNFKPHARHGAQPLCEPGIAAAHADLVDFDPDLVIVFHSTGRGPFVNFDGPAEAEAGAFAAAAGLPWRVVPSMGYPTPGSLGSWMGVDRGTPILTIEFLRGSSRTESGPAVKRGIDAVLRGLRSEPIASSPFLVR